MATDFDPTTVPDDWNPDYTVWRHGGWYVGGVAYVGGAVGCVSRNYPDGKWRIVCHRAPIEEQPTFANRDAAARAEYLYSMSPDVVRHNMEEVSKYIAHYEEKELESPDETRAVILKQQRAHLARGQAILDRHALNALAAASVALDAYRDLTRSVGLTGLGRPACDLYLYEVASDAFEDPDEAFLEAIERLDESSAEVTSASEAMGLAMYEWTWAVLPEEDEADQDGY